MGSDGSRLCETHTWPCATHTCHGFGWNGVDESQTQTVDPNTLTHTFGVVREPDLDSPQVTDTPEVDVAVGKAVAAVSVANATMPAELVVDGGSDGLVARGELLGQRGGGAPFRRS